MRKTVTAILNKCVICTCKKSQGRTLLGLEPSDLPKFRLDFDYAFCNTGVDFARPLSVKDICGKSDQMFKNNICLFTCATTRNVHLELTPSMDASDVIKTLVQFLSRRGCTKVLNLMQFLNFYCYIILIGNLFYLCLHGGEVFMSDLSEQLKTLYERY